MKYRPLYMQKPTRYDPIKHADKIEGSYIQQKIDGVSSQILCDGNEVQIWSGHPAEGAGFIEYTDRVPQIVEELKLLNADCTFQGEVYSDIYADDEMNFKYASGAIRSSKKALETQQENGWLKLVIYDMPSNNAIYKTVYAEMQELFNREFKYISLAPILGVNENNSWIDYFNGMVAQNKEGIVLRLPTAKYKHSATSIPRSNQMWKIKAQAEREVCAIEKVQGTGKFKDTLGMLICRDGSGKEFGIGSFTLTNEERDYIWNNVEVPFILEMRFAQETQDSYRHPIMTRLRDDKDITTWNKVD